MYVRARRSTRLGVRCHARARQEVRRTGRSSIARSGPRAGAGGRAWGLVTSVRGKRTCGSVDVHACTRRDVRGARAREHERAVTGAERVRELTSTQACARSDAKRLALELVTGVLFTREHDIRPKRRKST
ncbi:hypothetical protein CDL15_Pgr027408 [Punica granatum]|uniref:Uncharacterized protein n=1 Tax=Punica granatum TaxID=22663 RepID=A0A218Y279_PUNGR|nr:hypothetical protein CDL15_Pgr027408 [Punica granatum]PKI59763.1 hypothetical protein CRG98_019866 [Punica granatum]